jgi:hypothetical protein
MCTKLPNAYHFTTFTYKVNLKVIPKILVYKWRVQGIFLKKKLRCMAKSMVISSVGQGRANEIEQRSTHLPPSLKLVFN